MTRLIPNLPKHREICAWCHSFFSKFIHLNLELLKVKWSLIQNQKIMLLPFSLEIREDFAEDMHGASPCTNVKPGRLERKSGEWRPLNCDATDEC